MHEAYQQTPRRATQAKSCRQATAQGKQAIGPTVLMNTSVDWGCAGQTAQMSGHLRLGLGNGLTAAEISALINHLAFYASWPNAMSAVPVLKELFAARVVKGQATDQWYDRSAKPPERQLPASLKQAHPACCR